MHGKSNDLLIRLRGDDAFRGIDLDSVMDPSRFVGRAPEQVEDFIRDVVIPIRQRYRETLGQSVELKVSVFVKNKTAFFECPLHEELQTFTVHPWKCRLSVTTNREPL